MGGMPEKFFITTAIIYPNSLPHVGTTFEMLGADVQARYRRMEGYDVWLLTGNDENTVKVSKRAAELGLDPKAYCDDMARQFQEVWNSLGIGYDVFIQTSSDRHKNCCRKFIQKVYDNGFIYKGPYEGWYCTGCEEFRTDKQHKDDNGICPIHLAPLIRRSEPCYFFKLSVFQDRLLKYIKENPHFIQPEIRRNEIVSLIENEGLRDINISRTGETWGIRVPFDPEFTIYVWFDALLTYITGIGYGDDEAMFRKYWPADIHFIGKDITRFHTALWPAMLWAAGEEAPRQVLAHGFLTVDGQKMSKTLGNVKEPIPDVLQKFNVNSDVYRYFFMRECPFLGDGDYSEKRFVEIVNAELANNLGNLFSREMTITWKNLNGVFEGTAGKTPEPVVANLDLAKFVADVRGHVEACRYNLALQTIVLDFLTPTNQYLEANAPWKLVKTDREGAKRVLFNAVQSLRITSILLKPFIPRSAETIYKSFNFPIPWENVKYADAAALTAQPEDLRVTAELIDGKVKPLFPRIG
jgi:methionyl-tRNA synthetase